MSSAVFSVVLTFMDNHPLCGHFFSGCPLLIIFRMVKCQRRRNANLLLKYLQRPLKVFWNIYPALQILCCLSTFSISFHFWSTVKPAMSILHNLEKKNSQILRAITVSVLWSYVMSYIFVTSVVLMIRRTFTGDGFHPRRVLQLGQRQPLRWPGLILAMISMMSWLSFKFINLFSISTTISTVSMMSWLCFKFY